MVIKRKPLLYNLCGLVTLMLCEQLHREWYSFNNTCMISEQHHGEWYSFNNTCMITVQNGFLIILCCMVLSVLYFFLFFKTASPSFAQVKTTILQFLRNDRNIDFWIVKVIKYAYILRAIPFSKGHWGGGYLNFFGSYVPPQFNFVDSPYLLILDSILHLETLCHPLLPHFDLFNTPYPCITNNFQVPTG